MEMASGLAEEVIRKFGELRLRVFGTSMAPAILPGDLVLVRRAGLDEISAGDVVLFGRAGRFFVHRTVCLTTATSANGAAESRLITRGDRLQQDDPPVSSIEILGRVVSLVRNGREISLDSRGTNHPFARLLRASDHLTFLYVRLLAGWRSLFFRGVKCRV
jgi:Peptidase S24-like